jgi:hypothetical protein
MAVNVTHTNPFKPGGPQASTGGGGGAAGAQEPIVPIVPGIAGPTAGAGGPTANDSAATEIINDFLVQYGLEGLAPLVWQMRKDNKSKEEIYLAIRKTPEYKARFPAMETLAQQKTGFNEGMYVAFERQLYVSLHNYGVTNGLYNTPEMVARMLIGGVDNVEVDERLKIAAAAVFQAPPEVRASLFENYAVGTGDLIGYYLDPDRARPLLEGQYAAAQVQAASRIQGVGTTIGTAERLATQGVTLDQALVGFGKVYETQPFQAGYGERVSRAQLEGSAFGEAAAAATVGRVQQGRRGVFQAGGGPAESTTGVTGLGSAATT